MPHRHFSETAPYPLPGRTLLSAAWLIWSRPPPALRIYVRNCGVKWTHCLDGQHKALCRRMSRSSFVILVSTFGSSGTARTKASEPAQKAVLEEVLEKDHQENRPALSFVTGNTAGENHPGLARSPSNLLKSLKYFYLWLCISCIEYPGRCLK